MQYQLRLKYIWVEHKSVLKCSNWDISVNKIKTQKKIILIQNEKYT